MNARATSLTCALRPRPRPRPRPTRQRPNITAVQPPRSGDPETSAL